MINLLRIDDRLIHGQIATTWIKTLQVDSIIVANDDVVKNELQVIALKMAVPPGIRSAIRSVQDAIAILEDPRCEAMKILVVVNCPKDALRIATAVVNTIDCINIGNYYAKKEEGKKQLRFDRNVYLNPEDMEYLKKMCQLPIPFTVQMVPHEPKKDVKVLLHDHQDTDKEGVL